MKKFLVMTLAVLLIVGISSVAMAGSGITGSAHDFSSFAWNASQEICRVCHVPHDHGMTTYLNGLLWNHEVSTATYTMYDSSWSSSLDGTQSAQPDGTAKLCLGCHDGTVAIDSFDSYAGGTVYISPGYKIPGFTDGANLDLRGTHPISTTYDDTADTNLKDPDATAMGISGTITDVLDAGKVQCSSCHDVHDMESIGGSLLRVSQTSPASGLCLTCHIK